VQDGPGDWIFSWVGYLGCALMEELSVAGINGQKKN